MLHAACFSNGCWADSFVLGLTSAALLLRSVRACFHGGRLHECAPVGACALRGAGGKKIEHEQKTSWRRSLFVRSFFPCCCVVCCVVCCCCCFLGGHVPGSFAFTRSAAAPGCGRPSRPSLSRRWPASRRPAGSGASWTTSSTARTPFVRCRPSAVYICNLVADTDVLLRVAFVSRLVDYSTAVEWMKGRKE